MKCPKCNKTTKFVDSGLRKDTTARTYCCIHCGTRLNTVEMSVEALNKLKDANRRLERVVKSAAKAAAAFGKLNRILTREQRSEE